MCVLREMLRKMLCVCVLGPSDRCGVSVYTKNIFMYVSLKVEVCKGSYKYTHLWLLASGNKQPPAQFVRYILLNTQI